LTAVAGTAKDLVYAKFEVVTGRAGEPVKAGRGALYDVDTSGSSRRLGAITSQTTLFSVSGSTLFAVDHLGDHDQLVRLWDLRTGTERDVTSPAGTFPLAAAPHGYIVGQYAAAAPHATVLSVASPSGSLTPLGIPFPGGQRFFVASGSASYVAYVGRVEQQGGVRVGSFTPPNRVFAASHRWVSFCGAPDSTSLACLTLADTPEIRLFTLHGTVEAKTTKHCSAEGRITTPTVLGNSAVWLSCKSGRLWQLAANGTASRSQRTFNPVVPPIRALHQIVLYNHARTELLGFRSAAAKPKVLAGRAA
jgi:hypothetical protein